MLMNLPRGENILDLVFTSEENMIENLSVGEHFGTSHQNYSKIIIRQNQSSSNYTGRQVFCGKQVIIRS